MADEEVTNSERAEAAESIGHTEDKVTTAAQEAVEEVTDAVTNAVESAEEAAEEVAEAVIEASDKAADKADIPELAGAVAQIVIDRLREAGLTVSQVSEEATDAAQDIAEAAEESLEEVGEVSVDTVSNITDAIAPKTDHWWFAWPPRFPRRSKL